MNWYVLHSKLTREYFTASCLQGSGIKGLSLKVKSKRHEYNKVVKVIEPIIHCSLFPYFAKDSDLHLISYTKGIRYIVSHLNPVILHDGYC